MRFIVVLVDATEEDALEFFETRITPKDPTELLFVSELTETVSFAHTEMSNGRNVDGIFFVSANQNLLPLIYQVGEELKNDPLTRRIGWRSLVGEQACEILYIEGGAQTGVPQPLLDMLIRKRGAPKLPN